jgi:hypothetical protein
MLLNIMWKLPWTLFLFLGSTFCDCHT